MRYDPDKDGPYLVYLYLRTVLIVFLIFIGFLFVVANFGLGYSLSKAITELM